MDEPLTILVPARDEERDRDDRRDAAQRVSRRGGDRRRRRLARRHGRRRRGAQARSSCGSRVGERARRCRCRARGAARRAPALRCRPLGRARAAPRRRCRSRRRGVRGAERRRLRASRSASRAPDRAPGRFRGARAALRVSARSLPPRARAVLPGRRRVRLRGPDDDRRRTRRAAVREVELPLRHRPTGRDLRGFVHRGRQLRDTLSPAARSASTTAGAPPARRLEGRRAERPAVAAVAALGLADDLWSGPERGFRAHLGTAGRPASSSSSASRRRPARDPAALRALLVGLAANALNQLDTRPGRALKAYLAARSSLDAPVGVAVLLASLRSSRDGDARGRGVERARCPARLEFREAIHGTRPVGGDRRPRRPDHPRRATSIGALIERTPGLAWLDRLGRA